MQSSSQHQPEEASWWTYFLPLSSLSLSPCHTFPLFLTLSVKYQTPSGLIKWNKKVEPHFSSLVSSLHQPALPPPSQLMLLPFLHPTYGSLMFTHLYLYLIPSICLSVSLVSLQSITMIELSAIDSGKYLTSSVLCSGVWCLLPPVGSLHLTLFIVMCMKEAMTITTDQILFWLLACFRVQLGISVTKQCPCYPIWSLDVCQNNSVRCFKLIF